ncbi:MAG: hypothetical protein HFJ47_01690 [Clostridia bacterium]|nr:hypothetical protein [Clostridia bacterium]
MDKIEIGEYVRTKTGHIGKIIGRHGGYGLHYELDVKKELQNNMINGIVREDNILKHNKNIIDLIEVGDFVNGYTVITINHKEQYITTLLVNNFGEKAIKVLQDNEIKTILTKEWYNQNCYRLEEQ